MTVFGRNTTKNIKNNYNYLYGTPMVASITNNLGFGISKYYEDHRNLIIGISNYFGSSSISSFEYQNDALWRRSQRVDNNIDSSVAITNSFAYNQYSEVTNAIMSTNNYNYTMDDIGNREDFQINTTSVDYENSLLNQSLEANSSNPIYYKSFQFDLDGNMITNDTWQYTWNGENRMTSATNEVDDTYITYSYDYQGRMNKKITDGETTLFYWNGNHIIAEMTGSVTNYYTWANGETLCANLNGETVFYCHDANKNVSDLVDDSGDIVAHYEYSPFGVITEQTGSLANENIFRFSNEVCDETTGLVEYKYRPYFVALGKFLSRDPIGVQGGPNEYGIGGNDLINKFDLWGLEAFIQKSGSKYTINLLLRYIPRCLKPEKLKTIGFKHQQWGQQAINNYKYNGKYVSDNSYTVSLKVIIKYADESYDYYKLSGMYDDLIIENDGPKNKASALRLYENSNRKTVIHEYMHLLNNSDEYNYGKKGKQYAYYYFQKHGLYPASDSIMNNSQTALKIYDRHIEAALFDVK